MSLRLGETTIDAPIERLISAFGDQKRKPEWMHDLIRVVTVQKFSKTKQIEYYHSAAPWPLDERDFLYMAEFDYFPKEKTFVLNLQNATHKDYPKKRESSEQCFMRVIILFQKLMTLIKQK